MTVKVWTFVFSTLLLVTGCSKSEVVTSYEQVSAGNEYTKQPTQQEVNNSPVPVVFDASIGEQATTRAEGAATALPSQGFGVFAYLTKKGTYTNGLDGVTSDGMYHSSGHVTIPNFMYNQRIYSTDLGANWLYSPTKYWPNDFNDNGGDVDNQGATGTALQHLSFFAYGPYVKFSNTEYVADVDGDGNTETVFKAVEDDGVTPKSEGIMYFTTNATTGDPMLYYKVGGAGAEDLVWGTAATDASYTDVVGNSKSYTAGLPITNATKMKVAGSLNFQFQHVLTALVINVGAYFDELPSANPSESIADGNYITLESVTVAADNLPLEGWLNLNNTAANTPNLSCSSANHSFIMNGADFDSHLGNLSTDTKAVIKNKIDGGDITGVGRLMEPTVDADDYDSDGDTSEIIPAGTGIPGLIYPLLGAGKYLMALPTTATFTVTAKYNVWTLDPRAVDGITKVENTITKTASSINMERGNGYALNIWLGMRTVDLTVQTFSNLGDWSSVGDKNWDIPNY